MEGGIVILGAGGLAREVFWHLRDSVFMGPKNVVFVSDRSNEDHLAVGDGTYKVVRDWRFESSFRIFLIGIGDPQAKKAMVAKAIAAGLVPAPTLVHSRALVQGSDCRIGVGGLIAPGCVITTNVRVGDYVVLNLNTTVGHDTVIEDYVTCNPGCNISGSVVLHESASLGTGTVVRQGIRVATRVVTGAQACVVKDVSEPGVTVVGTPARKLSARA